MGRLIDADNLKQHIIETYHDPIIVCNDDEVHFVAEIIDEYPTVEARLKADMVAMLNELQYDLYHELCKEIHGKEDCPCTNQTTSCLATFRVCDADVAIGRAIKQKINALKETKDDKYKPHESIK